MNLRGTEGAFVDLIGYIRHHICQTWMEARMPGSLQVRNLEDDLIVRLKRRAARHGRSTEAEHREILRQTLASQVEHHLRHSKNSAAWACCVLDAFRCCAGRIQ